MLTRPVSQIHNAMQNPVELDMHQANAVEARTILDLRVGSAFTRMQTVALQNSIPELARDQGNNKKNLISYGTSNTGF